MLRFDKTLPVVMAAISSIIVNLYMRRTGARAQRNAGSDR
jgi:hypothetical protein